MKTFTTSTDNDFFRNQIADLAREKHELLDALKASTELIQEAADYYERTGIIDKVKDSVIKRALSNQAIILKHKL